MAASRDKLFIHREIMKTINLVENRESPKTKFKEPFLNTCSAVENETPGREFNPV